MDDQGETGAFYLKDSKTLLFGVPKPNVLATQRDKTMALLPVKMIMKRARLSLRDVETVAFTTYDNFVKIVQDVHNKETLYEEFQEFLRHRQNKKEANVIAIIKDDTDDTKV